MVKTLLRLSAFACIPLVLFGVANPLIWWFETKAVHINSLLFLIYIIVLCMSLGIIVPTILLIFPYASKIQQIESAEKEVYTKQRQLDLLIERYNDLILHNDVKTLD